MIALYAVHCSHLWIFDRFSLFALQPAVELQPLHNLHISNETQQNNFTFLRLNIHRMKNSFIFQFSTKDNTNGTFRYINNWSLITFLSHGNITISILSAIHSISHCQVIKCAERERASQSHCWKIYSRFISHFLDHWLNFPSFSHHLFIFFTRK